MGQIQPGVLSSTRLRWKIAAIAVIAVATICAFQVLKIDFQELRPDRVRAYAAQFGAWAPAVYLIGYSQPVIPLPASLMILAGGILFGTGWGMLAALGGTLCRACSQYALARLLGREVVQALLPRHLSTLDRRLNQHGFKAVLLMRLVPIAPFDVQNYALGISGVRFPPFAAATFCGVLPACVVYVWMGNALSGFRIWAALALVCGMALFFLIRSIYLQRRKRRQLG